MMFTLNTTATIDAIHPRDKLERFRFGGKYLISKPEHRTKHRLSTSPFDVFVCGKLFACW
jgi:hypothetical protein